MARTKTEINHDRLLEILSEVEGETGVSNRGSLYQAVASKYNESEFVQNGSFKPLSHTIVRWRLDDAGVHIKTPLRKRSTKKTQDEILSTVENNTSPSCVEETPDGSPVETPKKKTPRKKKNDTGINVVRIPRGECQLPLTSFDSENILNWVERMRQVSARNNEYLTVGALQFYINKNILPDDKDKAREVCEFIKQECFDEY